MTETEYTLDQFELDFEDASNLEIKREVLSKALDNFDCSDPIVMETLSKYREELKDLKSDMDIEEDARCNKDIDSGVLELYTCIKEVNEFVVGQNYYVKTDSFSKSLGDKWSETGSADILAKILSMKPLIWIYTDNGIGTLKRKSIFIDVTNGEMKDATESFSEHFVKLKNK